MGYTYKKRLKELREKSSNWIAGAVKKPGALRKSLKIKKGETIPAATINKKISNLKKGEETGKKLPKSKRTMLKRLVLAKTFKKMHK